MFRLLLFLTSLLSVFMHTLMHTVNMPNKEVKPTKQASDNNFKNRDRKRSERKKKKSGQTKETTKKNYKYIVRYIILCDHCHKSLY